MSIELTITSDAGLAQLARDYNDLMPGGKLFREINREILPPVERLGDRLTKSRLGKQPPKRTRSSPKFIYSLDPEKQRRAQAWVHIHYPDGYERTGEMAAAWEFLTQLDDALVTFTVQNKAPGNSYVYGSEPYGYRQVPGHVTTGWLNAGETAPDVLLEPALEYETRLEDALLKRLEKL